MRRIITTTAALVLLAGCSGGTSDTATPTPGPTATAQCVTAESEANITLTQATLASTGDTLNVTWTTSAQPPSSGHVGYSVFVDNYVDGDGPAFRWSPR